MKPNILFVQVAGMEKIRDKAMFCVGRAVFFGYLAISMVMLGSMFDLSLSFRSGAILCLIMALILLYFAQTAPARPPENTETWLLLKEELRPRNAPAREVFGRMMQEVYVHYAVIAVKAAIIFALAAGFFSLIGFRYIFEF